jgi:hypothetical protein
MKITCDIKVGSSGYCFEVSEPTEMESLHKAIVFSNPRTFCPHCKDVGLENKHFTTNKDKEGNIYVNVKCGCGARSKLGRYKTGGYFWHEYEIYNPAAVDNEEDTAPSPVVEVIDPTDEWSEPKVDKKCEICGAAGQYHKPGCPNSSVKKS